MVLKSQSLFRALFFIAISVLVAKTGSSQDPNECHANVLSQANKVIVSWSGNVGKLTPDAFSGICFGKVHHYSLVIILCWNKTTESFSFSRPDYVEENFNPRARINLDGFITVSVEFPLSLNADQTMFWDVQWRGMHNRVIDEMLYCTYKVGSTGCGNKAHRTVLGTKTKPGEWPWQVSIKHKSLGHWCGGSVVGQRWILTAAKCFDGYDHKDFTVVVGDYHLHTSDGSDQDVFIQVLYKHPRYNMSSVYNYDAALLKLEKTLQFNDRVQPVCFPETDFVPGTKCFVTGWGKSGSASTKQNHKVLKQAKVPLVSRVPCKRRYRHWRPLGYRVTRRMRCAGYHEGGHDSCISDTGGPLMCERNHKWYLLGVASWGAGCSPEGGYGVYADMLKLKKWIRKITQNS